MIYQIKNLILKRSVGTDYSLVISNLQLAKRQILAITGPSGCGKSTTLDLLGLALACTSCEQFIFTPDSNAFDIHDLFMHNAVEKLADLRNRYIGYVLQTGELLPFLSTLENMTLTARMIGIGKEEAKEEAYTLAQKLRISDKLLTPPALLSVGERQRVAIIRALLPKPALLLADEPTAALDPLHARIVMESMLELVVELGTTLVFVTHDQSLVTSYGMQHMAYHLTQTENHVTATLQWA